MGASGRGPCDLWVPPVTGSRQPRRRFAGKVFGEAQQRVFGGLIDFKKLFRRHSETEKADHREWLQTTSRNEQ
jgi:hypothetical protein